MPRSMQDILCKSGEPWCGMPTMELISEQEGPLATMVAETEEWIRLSSISVLDHITEPRKVEDYVVQASKHFSARLTRWELLWLGVCEPILLGEFTTEEGAKRVLQYLKDSAK